MSASAPHRRHAPGFPLVSYQPFRLAYWLGYKAWILARVPFWVAYLAVAPRWHEKWTLSTTLSAWVGQAEGELFADLGITEELSLEPGDEQFQVVAPGPPSLYRGPLEHAGVKPAPIGITWYPPAKPDAAAPPFVVYHLHGGAFVWGSGRAKQMAFLASTMFAEAGATSIYAPQYRLSGYGGQNPFPAALQDALTGYLHLLHTLRVPPEHVVVMGDSAGGSLAVALVRYLEAFGPELGLPRPLAAVLVSPWLAPAHALGPRPAYASNPHWATDYMPFGICRWGARVYTALVPAEDPYISALGNPFRTGVPLLITLGEAEVLEVEGTAWLREMRAVAGNRVEACYEEAAPHDTLLLGAAAGWAESAKGVARRIGGFVAEARRGAPRA